MSNGDGLDSSSRAIREVLVAIERGNHEAAAAIARAYAASRSIRPRVVLVLRLRGGPQTAEPDADEAAS